MTHDKLFRCKRCRNYIDTEEDIIKCPSCGRDVEPANEPKKTLISKKIPLLD